MCLGKSLRFVILVSITQDVFEAVIGIGDDEGCDMTIVSESISPRDRLAEGGATGPSEGHRPRTRPVSSRAKRVGYGLGILAAFAVLGALADWDAPEFGRHPDEAAHFITGTLVHDWAVGGFPRPPLGYALQYYARYPKVALGHWPPVFYVLQGGWYGLFGVSRASTSLLMLSLSAGFLLVLFECLRRQVSWPAALLAVGVVAVSPVFRYVGSEFLAETLVATISLGAVWCYAKYLEGGRLAPSLGFGALSALAILTKQDAIVLGAVPPLAVLFLHRWELLKDWRFYVPVVVVLAVCLPYHLLMLHTTSAAWEGLGRKSLVEKAGFLLTGLSLTGWSSVAVAALGAAAVAAAVRRSARAASLSAVLAAYALGVATVQMATPVSLDPRYKTALLPPSAFLVANAFQWLLSRDWGPTLLKAVAVAGLAGLLITDHPAYLDRKVTGYRQVVAQFANRSGLQVVLVCSDSMGDGAIVAEFRLQHPSGQFCVLRADKVLSSSTWMNQKYRLIRDNPRAIEDYLVRQPVHFVVIDDWGRDSGVHHAILAATLEAHPDRFPLIGTFPVVRSLSGHEQEGEARLYRVAATGDTRPSAIQVHIPGMPGGGNLRVSTSDF
jgi:4-amino-4-deoxy-L-arabinose transferase-like glycosyltransferase